jgi:hypothetical protein
LSSLVRGTPGAALAAAKRRAGRWTLAILFRPLADEAIDKSTDFR